MTSAGEDQPAGSGAANPRKPNLSRVVSRLLSPGDDEAAQDKLEKLVYSIDGRHSVLVELHLSAGVIADEMREQFRSVFHATFEHESEQPSEPLEVSSHYMRCLLTQDEIAKLAGQDAVAAAGRTIYRIWPDFRVHAHIDGSLTTIKSDAAARTYGTSGAGIVWAVIDSGIDKDHPHFAGGTVTDPAVARLHRDFTGLLAADGKMTDDPASARHARRRHHRRHRAHRCGRGSHRCERTHQR
jgi:subtilisin family serine protease